MPNLTIQDRHRVRKDVRDAMTRNYWDSKEEAITSINGALQKHNMRLDVTDYAGDEGSTVFRILAEPGYRYLCDACLKDHENPSFDNTLNFSWYKVPPCWKIKAYIS